MLQGKKIIVGISGGIAAYKAPLLVRLLVKAGAQVRCVCTDHALQFVTPLTLETVSQNKVYYDLFSTSNDHSTEHIALKDWADALVLAPATANIIGKLASGIADDALSTLLISFARKPMFICPAMNTQMWECPSVQRNIQYLRSIGIHFIEPADGQLACGTSGKGRMEEPEQIFAHLVANLGPTDLQGRHILVTAGPTYEKIDAVRFVGNFSTGKMGFALADALARHHAKVSLVSGPSHLAPTLPGINRIDVTSAQQMFDASTTLFPQCDAAILSAAVADFRPDNPADIKIKKVSSTDDMTIHMVQNPDILATLGQAKHPNQRLVGFALETNDEFEYAKRKLERKNLDFIVLNSLQDKGAGFGHNTNKVTIIDRDGTVTPGPLKTKQQVAEDIVSHLAHLLA